MRTPLSMVLLGTLLGTLPSARAIDAQPTRNAELVARGRSLELPGTWAAPPGDALEHQTAGFAKTLCSNVFFAGLSVADAAANLGFFTGPLAQRKFVVDTVVDVGRKERG